MMRNKPVMAQAQGKQLRVTSLRLFMLGRVPTIGGQIAVLVRR